MDVFEGAEVPGLDVLGILEGNNVFSAELVVTDQIPPHFRFDVESLHRVVCEDIAGVLQGYNVGIIREDLEGDRINHFPFIISRKMQLD